MAIRVCMFFVVLLLGSCREDPNRFVLKGKTSGIDDGTMVYLLDLKENQVFDSTVIRKNQFEIRGSLKNIPTKTLLMTDRGEVSAYAWLTPGDLLFDARSGSFAEGLISGSSAQEVYNYFVEQVDSSSTSNAVILAVEKTIHAFPNSKVSADLLAEHYRSMSRATTDSLYQKFLDDVQFSDDGKQIARYLDSPEAPGVGDPFTDFRMNNPLGQPIRFSDHHDKLTLLYFWASWCDTCRANYTFLRSLEKVFGDRGLALFGVSLDYEKEDWVAAIQRDSLSGIQLSDLQGQENLAAVYYGVEKIPANFLFDEKGIVLAQNLWGDVLYSTIKKQLQP